MEILDNGPDKQLCAEVEDKANLGQIGCKYPVPFEIQPLQGVAEIEIDMLAETGFGKGEEKKLRGLSGISVVDGVSIHSGHLKPEASERFDLSIESPRIQIIEFPRIQLF